MIRTLRIKLMHYADEWSADIEIDSTSTLDLLHYAIQKAVGFDDDHLYAFYIARTERSHDREYLDDENGRLYTTTLDALFPVPPRKSFFYLFDFGDSWIFKVTQTRKRPHDPQAGVAYPRVVAETGTKPEQYPGCDDDEL